MEKGKADRGPGITARLWDSSLIQNSASESLQIGQRSEMKGSITMKKLMIAATAALCATVGFGELASANIVGYTTLEVTKEYSILAINFKNVDGTDSMPINSVLPYTEGMTKGAATSTADQIQVMRDDGGYNTYFMCNGLAGKATVTGGDGKWVKDGQYAVTEDTISNGSAFWYVSKAFSGNASATPYNITVAGSVEMASATSRDIAQSYMLIGNPYPCEVPLNDCVQVTSGATKGAATTTADQIQIMREDGGYNTYFLSNGSAGKATVTGGDGKWVKDGEYAVTADTFPAGRGAWFISKSGTATVEFISPIEK